MRASFSVVTGSAAARRSISARRSSLVSLNASKARMNSSNSLASAERPALLSKLWASRPVKSVMGISVVWKVSEVLPEKPRRLADALAQAILAAVAPAGEHSSVLYWPVVVTIVVGLTVIFYVVVERSSIALRDRVVARRRCPA